MAHAERILRNVLDKIILEQKFNDYDLEVKKIYTGGANYTSHLYLVAVTSENGSKLNLFAKVAAIGEKMRSEIDLKIYSTEQLFYTELAKVYQQIEDEHGVPEEHRVRIPKVYGCSPTELEETIVLEDLTSQGFTTHDRFKSMEWEYAAAAVRELAKLHALSISYQHQRPEEFEQLLQDLEPKWSRGKSAKEAFLYSGLKVSKNAVREENKGTFEKFFDSINSEVLKNYFAPLRRAVITHGDFRTSNIMHRIDKDGGYQMIAVDYQIMRRGSPIVDLLYFIFTGTDEQFRAVHYQRLLDHYHEQLSLALRRLHLDPDEKYSKKDFELELKEKLPLGLIIAVVALPIAIVDEDQAPEMSRNMDLMSFSVQETGDAFSERLNGIVDDYVKWGVLK